MGIPWDGTGINCYGMGKMNMSHGQPCLFAVLSTLAQYVFHATIVFVS